MLETLEVRKRGENVSWILKKNQMRDFKDRKIFILLN